MMNQPTPSRRDVVRRTRNGLDYTEFDDSPTQLLVYLLGAAPEGITPANIVITGGRRVRDLRVTAVEVVRAAGPADDDALRVTFDRVGDAAPYTLRLVATDEDGLPTEAPFPGFDVRYMSVTFTFDVSDTTEVDCDVPPATPPRPTSNAQINLLAKDFSSFRQVILDRLALVMPGWRERHLADIGMTLVDVMAYVGDYLSYYQDAVATEAYLNTARQRVSIRRHARLVDYQLHEGCNARAWLHLATDTDLTINARDVQFIAGTLPQLPPDRHLLVPEDLEDIPPSAYIVYEPLLTGPDDQIVLREAHTEIGIYTWGGEVTTLPAGSTSATLVDRWLTAEGEFNERPRALDLKPGDFLLLEEVVNPGTGNTADAALGRRHVVRLTDLTPDVDTLYEQPIVHVNWHAEDALPVSLCLRAEGPPPDCSLLENVSVARGNIILVDHGRTLDGFEAIGRVRVKRVTEVCELPPCPGEPPYVDEDGLPLRSVIAEPRRYRPTLDAPNLTFRAPLPNGGPATALTRQDPRAALPVLDLRSIAPLPSSIQPLFTVDMLATPYLLGVKLATERDESFKLAHIFRQLSRETRDALEDYTPSSEDEALNRLPEPLHTLLLRDLFTLLEHWQPRRDLLGSTETDRHVVVEMHDNRTAQLRFGDGNLGRQPAAGTVFIAQYRTGGGKVGNIGAEAITRAVFRRSLPSGVQLSPRNPLPATGGTPPEPTDDARRFAPHAFRGERLRAITPEDYAELAMEHPDVQRAVARQRWTGRDYDMEVAVDPYETEDAPPALLDEVRAHLIPFTHIGHRLSVVVAEYVPLRIAMTVTVKDHIPRGEIKGELLSAFSRRAHPDGTTGYFHPDNLSFGQAIYLSQLIAVAQAVDGVAHVNVTRFERFYDGSNGELASGVLPLDLFEIARCDNDPSLDANGVIQFTMRGGR